MPNPGDRNREFVRITIANHLFSLNIQGVGNIYPGMPLEELFDAGQPGSLYSCNLGIHVGDFSESFKVQTGPGDYGGYLIQAEVMLTLKHRAADVNTSTWLAAESDHDRILDAIKTGLKGPGRDLGRPDVILVSAAWPSDGSIRSQTDEPVYSNGQRDQWSRIFWTVSFYQPEQP